MCYGLPSSHPGLVFQVRGAVVAEAMGTHFRMLIGLPMLMC
jgi:hypothetical protein